MAQVLVEGYLSYGDMALTRAEEEERKRQEELGKIRQQKILERQQHQMRFNGVHVTFMAVLVLILLNIWGSYIYLQCSCKTRLRNIQTLEQEIEYLRKSNDETEISIEAHSANLSEIYQIATEELGMIYPGQTQIIHYQSKEREYVEQKGNIPAMVSIK